MKTVATNKFTNKEIVELLRSIAAVYLLTGVNRFRIMAYENAADAVEHLTREIKDVWEEGKLYEIPGIGLSIGSSLDEYFKTGKSKHFESTLGKVPSSVFVLMKIPSIGPKKAFKLVNLLKLLNPKTVIEDLKKAALAGKIETLETFGKKSQEDILEAVNLFQSRPARSDRMPLPYAFALAKDIIRYLKKNPLIQKVDTLGSLRRMVSSIGDIDIALQINSQNRASVNQTFEIEKEIVQYFLKYPKILKVENMGDRKASIIVPPNIRVDLRVQDEVSYGAMLQYFTGSKAHNIKLREFGLRKGYSLNEYGIKNLNAKSEKLKVAEFNTEEKFYNFLGLQYVPPEIREGTNEIELASKREVPRLVEIKDIRGDLHVHSSYDLKPSHDRGENSYREILDKAHSLHYEYVGFTDHNPKIKDLSEDEIISIMKKRKEYIERSCHNYSKVRYFIGLEVDILPSGKLALPEEAIEYVDYLVVSVHSAFSLNVKTMTERVLKALNYPKVKILGHPTGRLLGKREGYELKWEKIFEFCKAKQIATEINSWPERLDLPDSLVREGLGKGVRFVIDTDAHAAEHMDGMFYGVSVARRGWCRKSDIMNTLSYSAFKEWIKS